MFQMHTFYEAVGYMISAQPNKVTQEKLISKLMELPNNAVSKLDLCRLNSIFKAAFLPQWDSLMAQAAQNMDVLSSMDNIKILSNVLKTNVSACTSIGSFYLPQIGRTFLDMLGLYKAVSGVISETVAREGKYNLRHVYFAWDSSKYLRTIKALLQRRRRKFDNCAPSRKRS
jgi:exportin-1